MLPFCWHLTIPGLWTGLQARHPAACAPFYLDLFCLSLQVLRQLLPAILTLAADADASVHSAGMAAAAEVFRAFPSDQQLQESLLGELASRGG
jgi:hypothetical protein